MGTTFLRLIPEDPTRVPSATAREQAVRLLERALPAADEVTSQVTDDVRFVDCGDNFEGVLCPSCGTEVGEWWSAVMEAAYEHGFRDLRVTTPCCGRRTALNQLVYSWPVGFARFTLQAMNPGLGSLPDRLHARLEEVLGGRMRTIWGHY